MSEIKLCKDCRHYYPDGWCSRVVSYNKIDLVTGEQRPNRRLEICSHERGSWWLMTRIEGACGKEGRFWEPKE